MKWNLYIPDNKFRPWTIYYHYIGSSDIWDRCDLYSLENNWVL